MLSTPPPLKGTAVELCPHTVAAALPVCFCGCAANPVTSCKFLSDGKARGCARGPAAPE